MKLLPMLLVNLVLVGGAILIYDQVRSEPAPALQPVGFEPDTDAFERRLQALEAQRRPVLQSAGADPRLLERLEALEGALAGRVADAGQHDDEPGPAGDAPDDDATPSVPANPEEPTSSEIRRFRKLTEAVRREERTEKNARRVDQALAKLSLNLSGRQREKIHGALAAFEPRVKQIWTDVKIQAQETIAAGGEVNRAEIVEHTSAVIQKEFAGTLDGVVSDVEAESIAKALMPGGR